MSSGERKELSSPLVAALALGLATTALAAAGPAPQPQRPDAELHFARLAFPAYGGLISGGRSEPWLRDWPESEYHFIRGIARLTRVDISSDYRFVELDDDSVFDYPLVYAVKVGFWQIDERDAARLREYLLRGGTLIVDDFHGPEEWQTFADSMRRVFPSRPIVEMPDADQVFHVLYDLDERVQIPGIQAIWQGVSWENPLGVPAHWRGIYDDDERLMVAINFNSDLGDAWEHADDAVYPEPLTTLAYRFAVNYVLYAMSH